MVKALRVDPGTQFVNLHEANETGIDKSKQHGSLYNFVFHGIRWPTLDYTPKYKCTWAVQIHTQNQTRKLSGLNMKPPPLLESWVVKFHLYENIKALPNLLRFYNLYPVFDFRNYVLSRSLHNRKNYGRVCDKRYFKRHHFPI